MFYVYILICYKLCSFIHEVEIIFYFGPPSLYRCSSGFEAVLFPAFQDILQKDVTEFIPYVFQVKKTFNLIF